MLLVEIGSDEIIQTPCLASYPTLVSLTAELVPPPWKVVIPGSTPLFQVRPASVEMAYPMSAPPPPEMRATWKLAMIVDANEKLPGSTSVACWLLAFVKVSVLSLRSGVVAGGNPEPELDPLFGRKFEPGPDPQLKPAKTSTAQAVPRKADFNSSPLFVAAGGRPLKLTGVLARVNAGLNARLLT